MHSCVPTVNQRQNRDLERPFSPQAALLQHAACTHTHTEALTDGSIESDGGQTDGQTEGDCNLILAAIRLSV